MASRHFHSTTAVMSEGGRVVIPAEIRKAMGLEPGNEVLFALEDNGELRLMSRKRGIEWAQEMVRQYVPANVSLVDEMIRDREEEAANE